eukprot:1943750-Amphidinium_carterae.1
MGGSLVGSASAQASSSIGDTGLRSCVGGKQKQDGRIGRKIETKGVRELRAKILQYPWIEIYHHKGRSAL